MEYQEVIKEYSKKYYKYIEDAIVPHEEQNLQIKYFKGELGFDEEYVREHLTNNNIKLI